MDPFYQVRQDIQDGLRDLQPRLARFHALPARSPERRGVAAAARPRAEALASQAADLSAAVEAAARDPSRFGLAAEEVEGRRRWVASARAQLEGAVGALRSADAEQQQQQQRAPLKAGEGAAAGGDSAGDAAAAASSPAKGAAGFADPHQQLLVARQDAQLEDVEQGLARLARVGGAIRDELREQGGMLDALAADVDATRALSCRPFFFARFFWGRFFFPGGCCCFLGLVRVPRCWTRISRAPFNPIPNHKNKTTKTTKKQNRRLGGVGKKMRDTLARSGTSNRQLALIVALMLVLVGLVVLVVV
jgi:syntaxin 6